MLAAGTTSANVAGRPKHQTMEFHLPMEKARLVFTEKLENSPICPRCAKGYFHPSAHVSSAHVLAKAAILTFLTSLFARAGLY